MSSDQAWRKTTLRQAGVKLIDCDHRTPPHAENGYPYIAIPQLRDGHIQLASARRISEADFLEWTKKLNPQGGDVIVVRRCNSGDSAVVPHGLECAIGQNLVILRSDGKHVSPEYLRWLVRGPDWWGEVKKYINVGAVFDSLKCREIPEFELAIPPLSEQQKIATLLNALDERITLLRETNTTLESIAQALFKSWFVDFDPVRAKQEGRVPEGMDEETAALFPASFQKTETGVLPQGWRTDSIYAVARVIYGAPFASSKFNSDGVGRPLIRIRDLRDEAPGAFTPEVHPKGYLVQPGDLIVGMDGEFRAYLWGGEQAWLNQRVCVFKPGEEVSAAFVHLSIVPILAQVEASETATTVIHLGKNDIDRFEVLIPDAAVMRAFAELTDPIYVRIVEQKQAARTLASLRDTLLPRLISGQLRLSEATDLMKHAA